MDQVLKLVEKITTSGRHNLSELEPEMKELKKHCKLGGDDVISAVFRSLMIQIGKKHSQVRVTSLLVMNELFVRSHTFRTLLIKRQTFDGFLENIGLVGDYCNLPPPKDAAKLLVKKAIEAVKQWNDKFGPGYPLLSNAYTFLSENGVDFIELKVLNPGEAAKLRLERKRKEDEDRKKLNSIIPELDMLETDIKQNIFQINNCLQLVYPDTDTGNGHEGNEFIPSTQSGNEIKVTVNNVIVVTKDSDSEDILNNLKDLYTTLVKDNLFKLKKTMSKLSEISGISDEQLKRAIDIKSSALSTLSKMAELKINERNIENSDSTTDDEDFVEVEPKDGFEPEIPIHERAMYGLEPECKKTIGVVDPNKRSCRVALSSGKLCTRMDAIKCPFHGKIVERDDEGNVMNQEDMEYEKKRLESQIPAWQEPSFLRDLEAATGLDLTLTSTKRKKRKFPGLKDVKKESNPKKRLADRIFSKDARLRVTCDLDSIDDQVMKKFEDNWAYALHR